MVQSWPQTTSGLQVLKPGRTLDILPELAISFYYVHAEYSWCFSSFTNSHHHHQSFWYSSFCFSMLYPFFWYNIQICSTFRTTPSTRFWEPLPGWHQEEQRHRIPSPKFNPCLHGSGVLVARPNTSELPALLGKGHAKIAFSTNKMPRRKWSSWRKAESRHLIRK